MITEHQDVRSGLRYLTLESAPHGAEVALLFLHGAGERGGDIRQVLAYGLPATLNAGTHSIDCTVICPHLESGQVWQPVRLAHLIDALRQSFRRIVICGYSLGGTGICELISTFGTLAELSIVVAGRTFAVPGDVPISGEQIFVEGEHDDWADTAAFRSGLTARAVPFTHVVLPGAGHFIAEASMEVAAVTSALEALGASYVRRTAESIAPNA